MQKKKTPENNNQDDSNNHGKPIVLSKSYCPPTPPIFTQEELDEFNLTAHKIRLDMHNLRYDKLRKMYFFLPKDHIDYRENPEETVKKGWCTNQ